MWYNKNILGNEGKFSMKAYNPEIAVILNHSTDDLTHDQLDIILQSNDIRLIKNILENHSSDNDLLDKIASHPRYEVRDLLLALNLYRDKDLDIFVHASDKYLRKAVAYCGRDKDLDILVHDNNSWVRKAVAYHGRDKDLDILVYDCDVNVRAAVAKHSRDKDLNVLVHDEDYLVRKAVAKHGRDKDLDILVHDENGDVRYEVAKHGRDKDLDILVNDDNYLVRKVVATVYKRDKD